MNKALKDKLVSLADRYEKAAFTEGDPSCFMHRYTRTQDQELVAFVAAALAFGRRDQILSHVETVLELAGSSPSEWVASGGWEPHFPNSPASFYRTYSHAAMRELFATLGEILQEKTLGDYFKEKWQVEREPTMGQGRTACVHGHTVNSQEHLCQVIARCFPPDCTLIPRSKD